MNRSLILIIVICLTALQTYSATINVTSSSNWSSIISGSGPGGQPDATDSVVVRNNITLTVNVPNATCGALQLASANTAGTVSIAAACSLSVQRSIYMGDLLKVGTLNMTTAGSVLNASGFIQSGAVNTAKINFTNGTVNLSGSSTFPNSTSFVKFFNLNQNADVNLDKNITVSGNYNLAAGFSLNLLSANFTVIGTSVIDGSIIDNNTTSIVTFQNVTFNSTSVAYSDFITRYTVKGNLTLNNCNLQNNVGANTWSVTGGLIIPVGTDNTMGGNSLTVSGTTTVDGTIRWAACIGARTFKAVNINSTGTWHSLSATGSNDTYTFTGLLTISDGTLDGAIVNLYKVNAGFVIPAGTTAHIKSSDLSFSTVAVAIDGTIAFEDVLGTKTFSSDLTLNSGSVWSNVANEDVTFAGNLTINTSFTAGTAKYIFAGSKLISSNNPITFAKFEVSSGGTRTNKTTITITDSLSGAGTFRQDTNAVLNIAGFAGVNSLTGNTIGNSVNYTSSVNTVVQKGSYYNVNFNSNVNYNITSAVTIANNCNINAGNLLINSTVTGSATGVFFLDNTSSLYIGDSAVASARTFPSNYLNANIILQSGSNVFYAANTAQTVSTVPNYSNLVLTSNAASVKTLSGAVLTVEGNLTISANATLNVPSKTVTVSGNFNGAGNLSFVSSAGTFNLNGAWNNNGVFTKGTSTVNFTSRSAQNIPAYNFHNLASTDIGNRTLASSGTIGISGTFTPGVSNYTVTGSTVSFNGSTLQTVPAFTFFNHTINNSGLNGVVLGGNVSLINTLTVANKKLTTTGFTYTLLSTATNTARIAPMGAGTSIVGGITAQRFSPGGSPGWAYIGSPVTNSTLADWYNNNTEIFMSGFPGVSFSNSSNGNFVSVYGYDESADGTMNDAASFITPTDVSNPLVNGKGYYVYLATTLTTADPLTFDVTGNPKSGTAVLPVTYTDHGLPAEDGWNLVANPYPSDIDWNSASWTKTNMENYFLVYNTDINNYATFTGGALPDSTNGGTRFIPSSQGFYVKANAASPVLSATENVKSEAQPTFKSNIISKRNDFRIVVSKENSKLRDEAIIRFNDEANDEFVNGEDVAKVYPPFGESVNIASISSDRKVTTNNLQNLTEQISIPVVANFGNAGTYVISFSNIDAFAAANSKLFNNSNLVLEDVNTGEVYQVNNQSIAITTNENNAVKKYVLRFEDANSLTAIEKKDAFNTVLVKRINENYFIEVDFNTSMSTQIDVYSISGQLMKSENVNVKSGLVSIDTESMPKGIYIVKVSNEHKQLTEKFYKN